MKPHILIPHVLIIGEVTRRMARALSPQCTCHQTDSLEECKIFLDENASLLPLIQAVLTTGSDGVPLAIMDRLPHLKLIANNGVGYDAIDIEAAVRRAIMVTHTPDVLNADVATTALMLLMACFRRLIPNHHYIVDGHWQNHGPPPLSHSIDGMHIGLLGYGRIGQSIAKKLEAFDCVISYHARHKRPDSAHVYYADLIDMARRVTTLIVSTPGGTATAHMVNREVIEAIGPAGCLINVARGSVVDEQALLHALKQGKIGYAGLDVFAQEPHVPPDFFALHNVVLQPHSGSATTQTRQAMGDLTVQNLLDYFTLGTVRTPVPECQHLSPLNS